VPGVLFSQEFVNNLGGQIGDKPNIDAGFGYICTLLKILINTTLYEGRKTDKSIWRG
jgi:hypothetical protein